MGKIPFEDKTIVNISRDGEYNINACNIDLSYTKTSQTGKEKLENILHIIEKYSINSKNTMIIETNDNYIYGTIVKYGRVWKNNNWYNNGTIVKNNELISEINDIIDKYNIIINFI